MRELSVYYCPHCGYYGYYQLPKNAVCPKCTIKMTILPMNYQNFMNLNCEERDVLLSGKIIASSSSTVVGRLTAPHKVANLRETIAELTLKIEELESENQKLNHTVQWMHDMIWDLVRKKKKTD